MSKKITSPGYVAAMELAEAVRGGSVCEDVGKARAMQGARRLGVFKNAVAPAQAGASQGVSTKASNGPLPAQGRRNSMQTACFSTNRAYRETKASPETHVSDGSRDLPASNSGMSTLAASRAQARVIRRPYPCDPTLQQTRCQPSARSLTCTAGLGLLADRTFGLETCH